MKRQGLAIIGLTAVVSFLLGLVVAGTNPVEPTSTLIARPPAVELAIAETAPPVAPVDTPPPAAVAGPVDFASVAARMNAAVVNVDTAARGTGDRTRTPRRYPGPDSSAPREGSGSGFIIDPAGFVLTNHHVVAGADRVTVTLSDGRAFRADIIGLDPAIDVALLKIHDTHPFPVAPIGDSDELRVGDWVCAIGNPLGVYVHSVTVGVVSFLGRKLFDASLDAYIQTDAAINFGNSGGPLINARGEVVGITTAKSAEAPNIGFAIPMAQVTAILPQLREHGSVARGFIGAALTPLTPALRDALRITPKTGAVVEDLTPDAAAARAGLRLYDVVVGADNRAIASDEELVRYISSRQPGTVTSLEVWRESGMIVVPVKLQDRPVAAGPGGRVPVTDVRPTTDIDRPFGLEVRDIDARTADRLRLPDGLRGVLVSSVDPAGPARLAQIRANQVVLEVNRRHVRTAAEFRAVVAGIKPGEAAAMLIYDRTTRQQAIYTVVSDTDS